MSVRNKSKKTVLAEQVRIAKSIMDKTIGLLKSENPEVLLFRTRFGIHTFGMKYAIDVVILDKKNRVAICRPSLPPNRIFFWNPRFDTVLELPEGIIEKTQTAKGDIIEIQG